MKNKKLLYILIPCVVLIWGAIIYKLFTAIKGDDDTYIPAPPAAKEAYDDYSATKDTTRLQLNYRDPFGMEKPADTLKTLARKERAIQTRIPIARPAINWDFVRYSGYIRNPGSKKLVALLHINGREVLLNEGESVDHVKLLRNMKDSIKINFEGHTKCLPINPAG